VSFHFDALSLVIGVAGAGIAFFFTGFLREAGKDAYAWLKSRWTPKARPLQRISVLDFFKEAQRRGFNLMGRHRTALTLASDLRQAALDETVQTWGRQRSLAGGGRMLVKIPATHWKEFRIYWEGCFELGPDSEITGFAGDNSLVGTHGTRSTSGDHRTGYLDIHLDHAQAIRVLDDFAPREGKST